MTGGAAEFDLISDIACELASDYAAADDDPWLGSPFGWIMAMPSRRKGAIGERLVERWCVAHGLDVARSPDSQADRVISGRRVEIKFSTLWNNGTYRFQQVRDQAYDAMICLGISPFAAHAWVIPKTVLVETVIGHMGQHTGATGTDTAWVRVDPDAVDPWLAPYGGTLDVAATVLLRDLGRR